jgi:hypothetical protein
MVDLRLLLQANRIGSLRPVGTLCRHSPQHFDTSIISARRVIVSMRAEWIYQEINIVVIPTSLAPTSLTFASLQQDAQMALEKFLSRFSMNSITSNGLVTLITVSS